MEFTPRDATLLAGQKQGNEVLASQTRTAESDLSKLMGQYGTSNPEFFQKMLEVHKAAEARARLRMNAKLLEGQLRSDIHARKLAELKKQWKEEDKQDRAAMWGSIIGSTAQLGSMAYGAATAPPPQTYSPYGPDLVSLYQQPQNYQSGFQQVPDWYVNSRR
jgi:hypothetical protein